MGAPINVVAGQSTTFTVVALDASGNVIPGITGFGVGTGTPAVDTASVNPDGSGGVVVGVSAGSDSLAAVLTLPDGTKFTDTSVVTVAAAPPPPPPPPVVASIAIRTP